MFARPPAVAAVPCAILAGPAAGTARGHLGEDGT